jgi:type I site-specific restriction endonuclease
MAKDEVQLGNMDDDDYEVIPLGPIRKLERRVEDLQEQQEQAEASGGGSANEELVRDILDIMKSNQKIVNDMTESTHELRNSVEDLTNKMDSVIDNMNEFMDLLNQASEMDMEGEVAGDIETRVANAIGDKMDDMVEEVKTSNEKIADNLEDLNTQMRKTYYASGDSGGGVANQSRPGQGQQQQQGSSQQRRNSGRQGGSGGGLSMGSDNSNRMENLKERFKSMEDNE